MGALNRWALLIHVRGNNKRIIMCKYTVRISSITAKYSKTSLVFISVHYNALFVIIILQFLINIDRILTSALLFSRY